MGGEEETIFSYNLHNISALKYILADTNLNKAYSYFFIYLFYI